MPLAMNLYTLGFDKNKNLFISIFSLNRKNIFYIAVFAFLFFPFSNNKCNCDHGKKQSAMMQAGLSYCKLLNDVSYNIISSKIF